jgi:hypothetical protein
MRNKPIKPVLLASKQLNICFIFAYICFEQTICSAVYNRGASNSVAPVVAAHVSCTWNCITEKDFLALEKAGIRCSNSPWASLIHLVPKKFGSWDPSSYWTDRYWTSTK